MVTSNLTQLIIFILLKHKKCCPVEVGLRQQTLPDSNGGNWDGSNNLLFLFEFTAFNPLEPFCFGGFVVHEKDYNVTV